MVLDGFESDTERAADAVLPFPCANNSRTSYSRRLSSGKTSAAGFDGGPRAARRVRTLRAAPAPKAASPPATATIPRHSPWLNPWSTHPVGPS